MIPNTSALLLNTSASNGNSNSENGRSAEPSLRSQAEIGFANLFGQRVSGAEHSGGSRNLPADRNSSGNRSDIMRATNDKQSARSAERNRAAERSAEERSRAANNDGHSREDMRVRAPESELPKNELNRSEQSDKANKTDKNARSQSRSQTERAEDSRPPAEQGAQNGEVQDARMEEAAASAEAVDAQTNAASEGGEEQAAQGEGDEAQEASGQEMLAALAAVPVQEGTELTAQEEIVVPQEEAAADALAAEKIAALADAAAKAVELPVAQAAAALQADATMQKTDPGAPILAPGLLEESAEGQLSEKAALTLNLALEDGQGKGAHARADQQHAALAMPKGAPDAKQLAAAQAAANASANANAKPAAALQTGDNFAATLAAKVGAQTTGNVNGITATAGASGAGAAASTAGASNSAAQAQHLNALTGSVPGQTNANGARTVVQQLPVYTPAGQKGWETEMSVRLSWLAQRGEGKAELVLSPPNMGKLGVSLHMNGDQMTAQFVAASAATRDMLEQALPRLRELLQQANIELAQADVSTGENPRGLFQGQAGDGGGAGASRRGLSGGHGAESDMASTIATHTASSLAALMGDGAIDIFA